MYGKANVTRSLAEDQFVSIGQPRHLGHSTDIFKVRQGDWISTFPKLFHRDDRYFPEASVFDANRFVVNDSQTGVSKLRTSSEGRRATARPPPKAVDKKISKERKQKMSNFLMPFGIGPGTCPARNQAIDLVQIFVLHILATVDLKICTELPPATVRGVHAVPPPATDIAFEYRLVGEQVGGDSVEIEVDDDACSSENEAEEDVSESSDTEDDTVGLLLGKCRPSMLQRRATIAHSVLSEEFPTMLESRRRHSVHGMQKLI